LGFQCAFHGEQFTMFCTTKKTMLCIKCFRDTSAEDRLHCVDIDTAYNQGPILQKHSVSAEDVSHEFSSTNL
jgi:hypothetical protein